MKNLVKPPTRSSFVCARAAMTNLAPPPFQPVVCRERGGRGGEGGGRGGRKRGARGKERRRVRQRVLRRHEDSAASHSHPLPPSHCLVCPLLSLPRALRGWPRGLSARQLLGPCGVTVGYYAARAAACCRTTVKGRPSTGGLWGVGRLYAARLPGHHRLQPACRAVNTGRPAPSGGRKWAVQRPVRPLPTAPVLLTASGSCVIRYETRETIELLALLTASGSGRSNIGPSDCIRLSS